MRLLRRAVRAAGADASRRSFLRTSVLAGSALALPPVLASCTRPRDLPTDTATKVAVVGAGIAGLVAARDLARAGAHVTVYEAQGRAGGRMLSVSDFLVKGAVTELGGEFIDTVHTDVLTLAAEYDLDLIDLTEQPYSERTDTFFVEGEAYSETDIVAALTPYMPLILADLERLPLDLSDLGRSPARMLDEMSTEAYFAHLGLTGWFRAFLESAFVTEHGLELGEQSALNFISMIGTELESGAFRLYGESDERFKVRGGNQQIADRIAGELGRRIAYGHRLERLQKVGDRYALQFRTGSTTVDVLADVVLCAIPFSVLRTIHVDVDLPTALREMIRDLHYGANAKTLVGFDRPFWHDLGASGVVYTDLPIQLAWDNTAMQGVQGAGLTMYSGGSTCRMVMGMDKAEARTVLLDALASVWPAANDHPALRFERMNWPQAPFIKASYSSFGPGQWSRFYGCVDRYNSDTLMFIGEHTDDLFRGYMNGGARSGRRAAERVRQYLSL